MKFKRVSIYLLITILLTLSFYSTAQCASTGDTMAGLGETVSESPYTGYTWQTPTNIYSNDAANAYIDDNAFDSGTYSYILKASNFNFSSVPDTATITGIVVKLEGYYTTGAAGVSLCQLLNTSRAKVGTDLCTTPFPFTITTPTVITIPASGTDNLWGNALTPSWVKDADFGVALGVRPTGNNANVYIDYVTINVYYTDAQTYNEEMVVSSKSSVVKQSLSSILTDVPILSDASMANSSLISKESELALSSYGEIAESSLYNMQSEITLPFESSILEESLSDILASISLSEEASQDSDRTAVISKDIALSIVSQLYGDGSITKEGEIILSSEIQSIGSKDISIPVFIDIIANLESGFVKDVSLLFDLVLSEVSSIGITKNSDLQSNLILEDKSFQINTPDAILEAPLILQIQSQLIENPNIDWQCATTFLSQIDIISSYPEVSAIDKYDRMQLAGLYRLAAVTSYDESILLTSLMSQICSKTSQLQTATSLESTAQIQEIGLAEIIKNIELLSNSQFEELLSVGINPDVDLAITNSLSIVNNMIIDKVLTLSAQGSIEEAALLIINGALVLQSISAVALESFLGVIEAEIALNAVSSTNIEAQQEGLAGINLSAISVYSSLNNAELQTLIGLMAKSIASSNNVVSIENLIALLMSNDIVNLASLDIPAALSLLSQSQYQNISQADIARSLSLSVINAVQESSLITANTALDLSSIVSTVSINNVSWQTILTLASIASQGQSSFLEVIEGEVALSAIAQIVTDNTSDLQGTITLAGAASFEDSSLMTMTINLALSAVSSMQNRGIISMDTALLLSSVIIQTETKSVSYIDFLTLASEASQLSESSVPINEYDVELTLSAVSSLISGRTLSAFGNIELAVSAVISEYADYIGQTSLNLAVKGEIDTAVNLIVLGVSNLSTVSGFNAIAGMDYSEDIILTTQAAFQAILSSVIREGVIELTASGSFNTAAQLSAYAGLLLNVISQNTQLSNQVFSSVPLIISAIATVVETSDLTSFVKMLKVTIEFQYPTTEIEIKYPSTSVEMLQ